MDEIRYRYHPGKAHIQRDLNRSVGSGNVSRRAPAERAGTRAISAENPCSRKSPRSEPRPNVFEGAAPLPSCNETIVASVLHDNHFFHAGLAIEIVDRISTSGPTIVDGGLDHLPFRICCRECSFPPRTFRQSVSVLCYAQRPLYRIRQSDPVRSKRQDRGCRQIHRAAIPPHEPLADEWAARVLSLKDDAGLCGVVVRPRPAPSGRPRLHLWGGDSGAAAKGHVIGPAAWPPCSDRIGRNLPRC